MCGGAVGALRGSRFGGFGGEGAAADKSSRGRPRASLGRRRLGRARPQTGPGGGRAEKDGRGLGQDRKGLGTATEVGQKAWTRPRARDCKPLAHTQQ